MTCPHCSAEMHADRAYHDYACAACGLCAPREVLEALAARLAPAGVLGAAGRLLLTNVGECDISFREGRVYANRWPDEPDSPDTRGATLAEVYEKLTRGDAHG
jgi:hypothetical protein